MHYIQTIIIVNYIIFIDVSNQYTFYTNNLIYHYFISGLN